MKDWLTRAKALTRSSSAKAAVAGIDGPENDPEFRQPVGAGKSGVWRAYASPCGRLVAPILLGFCTLGTVIVIIGIIAWLVGLAHLITITNETLKGLICLFIVGVGVSGPLLFVVLRIPFEISISDDRTIAFRRWTGTVTLRPEEILSIRTGGFFDPQRRQLRIRHKGGKWCLINSFPDFPDFLATLKALNPAVEIKGF